MLALDTGDGYVQAYTDKVKRYNSPKQKNASEVPEVSKKTQVHVNCHEDQVSNLLDHYLQTTIKSKTK